MKLLFAILLAAALAHADDSDSDGGGATVIQGRTGSSSGDARNTAATPGNTGGQGNVGGNTRLFGGGGLNSLFGLGSSLLGGFLGAIGNPNFNPGFGGGFQQGFGGQSGFGGRPAFGGGFGNPGFGGGFGNPGFGGGFGGKQGQCPPVRPQCPPVRNFAPPQTCFNDFQCSGIDKCCFDRCLEETICKPPIGFGR
ncbi:hypothetical protein SK128_013929 [Halocaridina rubra]|uniref:WAP domain-containing protein n=1 Tax=Halocaridina rubra TaxID=373956 RepID=A0AAN8X906_HALRR